MDLKKIGGALARWVIGMAAAWLIRKGVMEQEQSANFIEIFSGAIFATAAIVWSLFQKWRDEKTTKEKIAVGVQMPVTATVAQVEEKHEELKAEGAFKGPDPVVPVI